MSHYIRQYQKGGCYFFTLVTHQRRPLFWCPENIAKLQFAIKSVKKNHPFYINAYVILPDHLHFLWRMPEDDDDFSTRWRLIKRNFAMSLDAKVNHRNEKEIWQRRFWDHLIRDEEDWRKHMDYIHYNPVKHGFANSPLEWPVSSFGKCIEKGLYDANWGKDESLIFTGMERGE